MKHLVMIMLHFIVLLWCYYTFKLEDGDIWRITMIICMCINAIGIIEHAIMYFIR